MRFGVVSSACFTLLTLAAASVAGAGGIQSVERAATATYVDAVGDAGDAPDIARVTIRPEPTRFVVDVKLAKPTELGRYGWILFGVDTDRNPFTGGGCGDELVVFTNGEATTLERWIGGRFTPDFVHHDLQAAFSGTDLTFVLTRSDLKTRSFNFAVASLRQQADLAPGGGEARYPRRNS
jgi:hypothetical protein